MNYTDMLEKLRKQISETSVSEEVAQKVEPIRPQGTRGFAPRVASPRSQMQAPQEPQYNPQPIISGTMQKLQEARRNFEKKMADLQKNTQEQKVEQTRPRVRPFNLTGETEETSGVGGFMTRPVAREDTLAHARANRDTSGFGTPRGPAGSNVGGTLLQLIDRTEGGGNYDTLFGHSQNGGAFDGVKVSEMTLAEAIDFSSQRGEGSYGEWVRRNNPAGNLATPMGRYQIVGSTLKAAVEELGLPLDTRFDSQTQDMIASHLARRRLEGKTGLPQMRAALRAEWEGFKHVSDSALDQAILDFTGSM
jgi:hypothetical protein